MNTNEPVKAPETFPGSFAALAWVALAFLVGVGAWYAWATENSEDLSFVLSWGPSPYPVLIVQGILVLIVALYSGSVQRTLDALASCLTGEQAGRVVRHAGLWLLGLLVKLLAWLVALPLGWGAFRLFGVGEEVHAGIVFVCWLLIALLWACVYGWGALMTAQSWIDGASRLLAEEGLGSGGKTAAGTGARIAG